ncbi:CocE/NonD family hydrolase [Streptomyces phaeoluteigriseus]|uniref:CocE/NonD family hydrolase n=1 Tax=Streptomyces phaeoluteigriseus TaxID=114686 RepID=A0ABY4ZBQ1_9ACTN|nr:CocE/NonD family hydrolase [Streptomyces phaeoluteigriseus]USQ86406.1 CocE/NonD family hydrolase [Streptomyces phaeoluteigriseus]
MRVPFERTGAAPVPAHARQHLVRMRDGTRLATDVYLPEAADEPLPAVLVRLPYDKNSRYVYFDKVARLFTARGYALVVQDVRGKFRSGGRTLPFLREPDDGYDAIDWITHQPWSDGTVGMFGDSYYGFTQWAAVASQHPALRAIVPRVTTVDFNATTALDPRRTEDGVGRPVWIEGIEYYAHHWVDQDTYDYEPDRRVRPVIDQYEQAFAAIGARSAWFDLLAPRRTDVLHALGRHPFAARPVPVLHCVGWYDNIGIPHMNDYLELASRPGWDAVQYLWAGAVDHENYRLDLAPVTEHTDHAVSDAALERLLPEYTGPALEFFDVFLKGSRPVAALSKVRWELGHEGWRTATAWPPPGTGERTFWLTEPAAATAGSLPGGGLSDTPAADEDHARWAYDPDDLVPSLVADSFSYLRDHPDASGLAAREDVLAFTGPVLSEPLDLAGPVSLDLRLAGTAPVFDVFAKLLDLAPDGTARLVVRGQVSVRGDGSSRDVRIECGHTGYRLRPGHRLALLLASSDYPMYLPCSGSEDNPWTTLVPKSSIQTLGTGGASPSRLTVTVLTPPSG